MVNKGITGIKEISRLLSCSERLSQEYLELFETYKEGDHWPEVYVDLMDQLQVLFPSKKKKEALR